MAIVLLVSLPSLLVPVLEDLSDRSFDSLGLSLGSAILAGAGLNILEKAGMPFIDCRNGINDLIA